MKELLCTQCLTQAPPKIYTPGNSVLEVILWLFLLLPGLIYSIWRHTARYKGCRNCEGKTLIPLNSPRARELMSNR